MYFYMMVLCIIWGLNFVIMKLGNGYFPPGEFAAFRFLTGSVVLFLVCFWKRTPLPRRTDLKWLILCGFFQTAYFNVAIQISLNYISAGLTSVLTYSMPLFLSLMAHRFVPGERLTVKKTLGIMIGIFGLFIAMNVQAGGSIWIMLLGLSSAVSWAVANIIFKVKLKHADTIQFTTWQMAIGTVGLFLYTFLFEQGKAEWGALPIFYVVFSGVFASALAFVMWNYLLRQMEANKASISLLFVPIVGVISGYLLLGENLSLITLVGIVIVLIGIGFVHSKSSLRYVKSA